MAWIESHSVLADHRKVRECAVLLGVKKVHLIGHLHCLWHKVIDLAEDGVITDWTPEDISYYAQWDGDPKIFYDALMGRWIDEKNGEKVVHDWLDYSWKYLYRKYHTANPNRLKEIEKLHRRVGKPKRATKGKTQVVLPNLPNQPNQPNLPEWIDRSAWDGFIDMRRSIGKPLKTDRAINGIIAKLDEFKKSGQDPNKILDQSTMNSWQGVFPLKKDNGKPQPDSRDAAGRKLEYV